MNCPTGQVFVQTEPVLVFRTPQPNWHTAQFVALVQTEHPALQGRHLWRLASW